jgi:hypothetical protein
MVCHLGLVLVPWLLVPWLALAMVPGQAKAQVASLRGR